MTYVVPFDGSDLSEAALVRASEFGALTGERVVAFTVVPEGNDSYARERGWIEAGESFDRERVVTAIHERGTELAPDADFRHEMVDRYASPGTIASHVRQFAEGVDASMVFVGTENAGRVVAPLTSVGATVAADEAYDLVIVRKPHSGAIQRRESPPAKAPKSDYYVPK